MKGMFSLPGRQTSLDYCTRSFLPKVYKFCSPEGIAAIAVILIFISQDWYHWTWWSTSGNTTETTSGATIFITTSGTISESSGACTTAISAFDTTSETSCARSETSYITPETSNSRPETSSSSETTSTATTYVAASSSTSSSETTSTATTSVTASSSTSSSSSESSSTTSSWTSKWSLDCSRWPPRACCPRRRQVRVVKASRCGQANQRCY